MNAIEVLIAETRALPHGDCEGGTCLRCKGENADMRLRSDRALHRLTLATAFKGFNDAYERVVGRPLEERRDGLIAGIQAVLGLDVPL